jgi:hypothetical protein
MRNATWKASAYDPAPRMVANTISRTRPSTRDAMVRTEIRPVALRNDPPDSLTVVAMLG